MATRSSGGCVAAIRGGFTLMEILVVIAILAILALMTIPSYQDRIVKEQIALALPLADMAKAPIALSWASAQTFPADNAGAGLPDPAKIVSNLVSSVAIRDGAIDITFGNSANGLVKGKIITVRPAVVEDVPIVPVTWICAKAAVPAQMKVQGEDRTNIDARYLPIQCRA